MVNQRLSPELLLQRAEDEERKGKSGKLKIYLGAAPGVGKTYSMLHDALAKRAKDLDVIVGVAESHGRSDIETMLQKLEILPRHEVDYRGNVYKEFDLDAALKRNPGLILVDEMAHTNAPGLRHDKRWQDIKELLDRGIDVFTTLNVQHIESLKDDISRIIQAPIKETVPDSMIERADTIVLIDLPPDELLKRLQEGKIYIPEQAQIAKDYFFRKGNLIALREFALRTTAERVGTEVLLYRHDERIKQIWPTKDKILVCVGSRADSRHLIRSAKRIANRLQAEWIAVYVDRPKIHASSEDKNNAIQNLRLAERLGAETYVLTGFDIVNEVTNFAQEHNVTQIMICKRILNRWQDWFRRNLVDEMVRHSGDIDVYIMTIQDSTLKHLERNESKEKVPWKAYGAALGTVILATLINCFFYSLGVSYNLVIVYFLAVTLTALMGRIGPSILASILSVLAYSFFFIPPVYSFAILDKGDFLTLLVMLFLSQVISHLTILARRHAESSSSVKDQTVALYQLSRQLMSTRGVHNLLELGTSYIAKVFDCDVVALMPEDTHLKIHSNQYYKMELNPKEQSIAQWVYDMGQPAGLGTDTLSFSKALYLPIETSSGIIGVLRVQPKIEQLFTPEQLKLLESCLNQVALSLEVDRLQEKNRARDQAIETEQARTSLLQAVFHDLYFPLKQITDVINKLKKIEGIKSQIIDDNIDYEVDKLNRLNKNLFLIIQLETDDLKLKKMPSDLKDIINTVIKKSRKIFKKRKTQLIVEEHLPSVALDEQFIKEVFFHLFDNAIKFSPPESPINIFVKTDGDYVIVSIEDFGSGVSLNEKTKLFKKFFRGAREISEHGLGLGLAICQKIIIAHEGKIWVENLEKKGAAFRFTLPLNGKKG